MRLIKKAVEIGNGAAVYVPKEYLGMEIVVTLPDSLEDIKKRVLSNLLGFMPNILGVYLYGSYARHEQEIGSDVDILVVTKEKDANVKNALGDIDARIVPLNELKKTIQNYPVLIMPILKEAQVLLNPVLLDELKNSKIDFRKFNWNFEEIKSLIKIAEEFIELDDEDLPSSFVYSLMMRIRVCYLIECLLKNKPFSNKGVRKLLLNYGLKEKDAGRFFYIYRLVREDEAPKINVKKERMFCLLKILNKYVKKIEDETKKKISKGN